MAPKTIWDDDIERLENSFKYGVSPNMISSDWTLLMIAAEAGKIDHVKLLLSKGADPDYVSSDGETILGVCRLRLSKGIGPSYDTLADMTEKDRENLKKVILLLEDLQRK